MSTLRARKLRNTLTPCEVILWAHLKRLRANGLHFRRQAPFKGYYLDFVCFSRRLVIEVDGGSHANEDAAEWYLVRDGALERAGFQVLRFGNGAVRNQMDWVMDAVLGALADRPVVRESRAASRADAWSNCPTLTASPSVPPHEGEGGARSPT
jgi:very-short-patch-repair endonuclease